MRHIATLQIQQLDDGEMLVQVSPTTLDPALAERLARAVSAAFAGRVDPVSEPTPVELGERP